VQFFPHGGIQLYAFVSYALPCQTAPRLSSVAQQQNLTEYWQEGSTSTAISTTFASDVVGQQSKIGGINFGAALVLDCQRQYETSFLSLFLSWVEGLLVLGCSPLSAANGVPHSKISVSNPSYLSLTVPWMEVDSEIYDRWL
jgi:hypothetical protein